ncbi:hypothetical protein [Hanstruepera ponticola]|uniref:hypothetical protein n=1 Tax=Hanstruepera ponticola TaxID=2042995 RepID=UPI00177F48EC|nr:hypothetical protein [Hanstruepera ponticola]
MLVFLKKIGFILSGFLLLSFLISYGSLWLLRQSHFYKPAYLANGVVQKQFDYIVLGASTGLTTIDTELIDSELDVKGINLAVDDTSLPSQYLMLQHFLAEGKQTDYCILAPNPTNYTTKHDDISDNDYRFLMYIDRPYVYDHFKNFTGFRAHALTLSRWLPTIGVSYYNAEVFYPSLLSVLSPERRNRFDINGNYTYPNYKTPSRPIENFENFPIDFTNNYLKKIKALCQLHDITLICYISPMEGKKAAFDDTEYLIIDHSDVLKDSRYFHDMIHVNTLGRDKASRQLTIDFNKYIITEQ